MSYLQYLTWFIDINSMHLFTSNFKLWSVSLAVKIQFPLSHEKNPKSYIKLILKKIYHSLNNRIMFQKRKETESFFKKDTLTLKIHKIKFCWSTVHLAWGILNTLFCYRASPWRWMEVTPTLHCNSSRFRRVHIIL